MGKPVALFFALAAAVILFGSFVAPRTVVADDRNCSSAYGIDQCTVTGSIQKQ